MCISNKVNQPLHKGKLKEYLREHLWEDLREHLWEDPREHLGNNVLVHHAKP